MIALTVEIINSFSRRIFAGFAPALATLLAPKCNNAGYECSKLAANSQNTLELKTEEWVSG